jgi:hypothetical protein
MGSLRSAGRLFSLYLLTTEDDSRCDLDVKETGAARATPPRRAGG